MHFQILIASCMIAALTKHVESAAKPSAFLVHFHKCFSGFNGTCYYAECQASTKGATYDCHRTYVSKNQLIKVPPLNLKAKDEEFDTYSIFQNGQDTGFTGTLKIKGDLFVYNRSDKQGKIVDVLCGTYSSEIDAVKKEELAKSCVFEGVDIQDVDNEGCLKKINSIQG